MIKRLLGAKGIHFLVTRFGPKKLRSFAFDEKYLRGDWGAQMNENEELKNVLRKHLNHGDLLIMGCGSASILEGLEEHGIRSALGIDLSEEAIRIAGRYASAKITFEQGDMTTIKFQKCYNVILFSESLYYVSSAQDHFLMRLSSHLARDGVFIVTFAEPERFQFILEKIRRNFEMLSDQAFPNSKRHLLIFKPHSREKVPHAK